MEEVHNMWMRILKVWDCKQQLQTCANPQVKSATNPKHVTLALAPEVVMLRKPDEGKRLSLDPCTKGLKYRD